MLSTMDGDPQTYVEYGKWFPADLPLAAVRQLADGVPAVSYTHLHPYEEAAWATFYRDITAAPTEPDEAY